jgi:hypothetical protein
MKIVYFVYKIEKYFANILMMMEKGREKCLFLFFTDYLLDAFYGWLNGIIKNRI